MKKKKVSETRMALGINHFMTLRLSAEKKVAYPAPGQDSAAQLLSKKGILLCSCFP